MEDKVKKYSHQETILEDPTTLKLQKYMLILEKQKLSKYSKMQKLPTTDNMRQINHWDLILNQSKYVALDFHEERKWKKASGYVMANKIAAKVKRLKSNRKIERLYQECLCLHYSMSFNTTMTDITQPNDTKNKNDQLNVYLKKNNSLEYLSNEFITWKGSISELKTKLTQKFGEKNLNRAQKFNKVLNFIENYIKIQEDSVKRMNTNKANEEMNNNQEMALSDFSIVFESYANSSSFQDHQLCTEYAENTNLDYIKGYNEIKNILQGITNEINELTNEDVMIANDQSAIINNSFNNDYQQNQHQQQQQYHYSGGGMGLSGNIPKNNDNSIAMISMGMNNRYNMNNHQNSNTVSNARHHPIQKSHLNDTEDDILNGLNQNHLLFKLGDLKNIKVYFEKFYNTDKFDILPRYNYKKMLGSTYDINSPKYDFENIYFKVFPAIYYNDTSFNSKTLIEKDLNNSKEKNKQRKSLKEIEAIAQYDKITALQKMIYLWGISLYGTNTFIVNEINNMFSFSHNLRLGNEEINYIMEKVLDEIGVDMHGSNMNLLTKNNCIRISEMIEAPIQIGTTSNFNYNRQLADYINGTITTLKSDKGIKEKFGLIQNSYGNVQKVPIDLNKQLSFIGNNPLYRNSEKKMKMFQDIKTQLSLYCAKVIDLNKNNYSKYDYYSMSRCDNNETITQISNKINAAINSSNNKKNNKLTKESLLNQFNSSPSDLSIKEQSEKILDQTQLHYTEIIEVISFYSKTSVEKEWRTLRTSWYQNNTEYKPRFKKAVNPNIRPNNPGTKI